MQENDALHEKHHLELMRYLMSRLGEFGVLGDRRRAAEDLAQASYARLLQYGVTGEVRNPIAYLKHVAARLLYESLARQMRDPVSQWGQDVDTVGLPDSEEQDDTRLDRLEALDEAMEMLNPLERRIADMDLEGRNARQIASELGFTHSRARRALTKTRKRLGRFIEIVRKRRERR